MGLLDWLRSRNASPVSLEEIRRSFNEAAADEEHFPSTIDPRIFHVRLIADFLSELEPRRVADIGSGKGRFARVLKAQYPQTEFVAFDLAEAMLRAVPSEIRTCCGSMTALPFPSNAF